MTKCLLSLLRDKFGHTLGLLVYYRLSVSYKVFPFFSDFCCISVQVRIQTQPGFSSTLRAALPIIYKDEGLNGFYKGLVPLWMRQIPYTMMKFACFEKTVELLYRYVNAYVQLIYICCGPNMLPAFHHFNISLL